MDDPIDELEEAVIACPTDEQLQQLFVLKRELVALRKAATPQRNIFARAIDHMTQDRVDREPAHRGRARDGEQGDLRRGVEGQPEE